MTEPVARSGVEAAVMSGPQVEDLWPLHGAQLGSLTPTLTAHATGTASPPRYAFTVCRMPEEITTPSDVLQGCQLFPNAVVTSGQLSAGVNSWTVPAGKLAWATSYVWWVTVAPASGGTGTESEKRTFLTGARQPDIGAQLAARGVNGQEFQQLAGNYTTEITDAALSAAGPPLSVHRSYNSLDARRDGMFGAGWSTRFDMKIEIEASAALLVTYPDGRRLRFAPRGDGGFQPPPGMFAALAEVSGGGWKLMDKSSTTYVFNAQGRLVRVTDQHGRVQELVYGTDGRLTTVTDTGGRSLTFTWNGTRVVSVSTPPVNGAPLTWTYEYQGDKLTKVCSPPGAGSCTVYGYATGSLYQGAVRDDEPVGYWRLGEPATGPTPTPSPICTIIPQACQPQPTTEAESLGWGAGNATYSSVTLAQPGALGGSTNTAATFSGSSAIALPDHLIPRLGRQLSMEMWFKTTASGIIASSADTVSALPGNGQPLLYVGTDGKLRGQFRITDSGGPIISPITSAVAVTDDAWHHVVLTGSATTQTLYLDGVAAGSLTGAIDHDWLRYATIGNGRISAAWPSAITVPAGQSAPWGFTGGIDEIAVYDHPLSAAEVTRHRATAQAAPHLLAKITLPSGRIWADNTYDTANDRIKTHTDAHGGTWTLSQPVYTPTTGVSTVTVTDPKGGLLNFEHDAWRGYRLVARTDQLGKKTGYTYDTGGYTAAVADPNQKVTKTTQDKRGNVLTRSVCSVAGSTPGQPASDPDVACALSQRPSEWYTYHPNTGDEFDPRNDRLTTYRDARSTSGSDNTYATVSEYTTRGDLAKVTTPATPDFPNGRSMTYTYTDGTESAVGGGAVPAGLVKSEKDARNNETTYRYTAAGDLAEQSDASGLVVKYQRDVLGRITSRTEVSTANPNGVTTAFTYDAAGRLATHTGPGVKNEVTDVTHTAQTRYTYDADGNSLSDTVADLTGGDPERKTTYTYDDYGRAASVTGPEGAVVRYTWDEVGARTSVTDEVGNLFQYGYTVRGELASRTLKNWTGSPVNPQAPQDKVLESYAYDPAGRLAATVDAMGRKLTQTYFTDDLPAQVIADDVKLNGSTTPRDVVLESNTYDAAGNLISALDSGGRERTDYVYDAAGRVTSETFDPSGLARKTAYVYDANDNVIKTTLTGAGSTRQEMTEFSYNSDDILTRRTVKNGADDIVTTRTVDERGLVTAVVDPRGHVSGADPADFTTTYRYDLAGQLVETRYPQVKVEKNGTVTTARPATRSGYDSAGRQTHSVDPEGGTVVTAFDKVGRVTSVTAPSYTQPGGQTLVPKVSYAYDAAGRQTSVTDQRGTVRTAEYDALGNPVRFTDPAPGGQRTLEYDLLGEQLAETGPTGARTEATYDDLGRQITRTVVERRPTPVALTTRMEYNDADDLTKTVAPGDKTSLYGLNAAGEVTSQTDPLGNVTTTAYDLAGRTTKITDPLSNASTVEYDLAGRQIEAKDLDGNGSTLRSTTFGYDAVGNQVRTTSGEGRVTTMRYDALGELVELVEPVAANTTITTTYGYDATGALTRTTDGRGNTVWTTYNSWGLAESVIEPSTQTHPAAADRTWTNVYDVAGELLSVQQPGGIRVDRQYDALGRLTKQTGTGAAVATPDRTFGYDAADRQTAIGDYTLEYNDRGLLTKVSKASNQIATFSYDAAGNPVQRADASGTTTFGWDKGERLTTAADPVSARSFTYGYDGADRLTTLTSATPTTTQGFGYDAMDRLTSHTLKNSAGTQLAKIVYEWNRDDDLVSKVTEGTAGAGTNTYGYDQLGRLTSWKAPNGNTTSYTWDAAGNRTSAGDKTFTYDERNRLISGGGTDYTYTPRGTLASETTAGATKNLTFDAYDQLISDGDVTYDYDALGRVVSRKQASDDQRFVYSGMANDIVAITDGASTVKSRYGRSPSGDLLGIEEGGQRLGVMSDLHDDVVATFSGTGLIDSAAYSPFGEVAARTGTQRALGYQGEYTDPATGKVNMHARWYMPGTGGFASRDDWTLSPYPSINLNRYTYGNANPLANTDPSGHCPICIPLLIIAVRVLAPIVVRAAVRVAARALPRAIRAVAKAKPKLKPPAIKPAAPKAPAAKAPVKPQPARPQVSKPQTSRPQASARGAGGRKGSSGTGKTARPSTSKTARPGTSKTARPGTSKTARPGTSKTARPGSGKTTRPGTSKTTRPSTSKTTRPGSNKTTRSSTSKTARPGTGKSSGSGAKGPTHNTTKLDLATEAFEESARFTGVDLPDLGGFDGCSSVRSCAKDVVEEFVDNTIDEVVNDVLDQVTPNLPMTDPPGTRGATCGPGGNSFVPGTRVLMADGSTKPIEDIKVADQVVATDPVSGVTAARPVVTLITGDGIKKLVDITVDIDGDRGKATDLVTATDEHPFWVPALRIWVKAADLQPGMWLQTSAGTHVQITALQKRTVAQRVHNLTVDALHTYHVVAGDQAVLVHNDDPEYEGDLYRADDRRRGDLFKNGFTSKGTNMSIDAHVNQNPEDSGYISTSRTRKAAEQFANENYMDQGSIYKLRGKGVNINAKFRDRSPYPWEEEVAVPRKIDPSDIYGAWDIETGEWFSNPGCGN
ncbi:LamG-like jellyroll fold domain-containing protein [Streptosporangium saharense]|uniref:LamG-like jellyroll fold domain-containing protein n=1 Tax=Streptosporangium saharense TaxID=1706840 RepID=UPI00332B1DBA